MTRRLIDVETHAAVFTWVLVGVDTTTLEANAAMRSIERRLAEASGHCDADAGGVGTF